MTMDARTTVGEVVTQSPGAAKVFGKHGIDFCCGGGKSLADVCGEAGLAVAEVLAEIEAADTPPETPAWTALDPTQMCDEIERRYHRPLDTEFGRLDALAQKVAGVHGERHPELREIATLYGALRSELEHHMMKEERVLFPMIRQMGFAPPPPVQVMRHEHEEAGETLRQLRRLANGYQLPDDACNSYRALYQGLEALERELHEHIHVENNILFPRAEPR